MKKIYSIILAALFSTSIINSQNTLITGLTLTGILDLTVPAGGSSGKAIQLTANQNISDLSVLVLELLIMVVEQTDKNIHFQVSL